MPVAAFIAGDWGTSHLRLFLCAANGEVIDRRSGAGAAQVRDGFAQQLDSLTRDWAKLPTVLCGMVGSTLGWVEAPYLRCPAKPGQIAGAAVLARDGVHIAPGLSCRNRLDAPDVMRGEETQILGALETRPALRSGSHLLCLPGTHTKWVLLDEGTVREFLTAATGEVFNVLRRHSILVQDGAEDENAFATGLAHANRFSGAHLLQKVFTCRSRRLAGELTADATTPYLSGLLVGSDVCSALQLFGIEPDATVHLIGAPQLTQLYRAALATHGCKVQALDGEDLVVAGLTHLHRLL